MRAAGEALNEQYPDTQVLTLAANIADENSVREVAETVKNSDLPAVGALANVAGVASPVGFLNTTLDEWESPWRASSRRHANFSSS